MKIKLVSIPVSDQEAALNFYEGILGFVKKHDIPLGGGNRWLTLVSKDEPDGTELLLEPAPLHFEPSKVYQKALYDAGMPCGQFDVEDLDAEYERLVAKGVSFSMTPTDVGTAKVAIFDDTCGNRVQLVQVL